jgi:hypothetical protein
MGLLLYAPGRDRAVNPDITFKPKSIQDQVANLNHFINLNICLNTVN